MEIIVHNNSLELLSPRIEIAKWSDFVFNHSNGNIFQTLRDV